MKEKHQAILLRTDGRKELPKEQMTHLERARKYQKEHDYSFSKALKATYDYSLKKI
jgi:predicted nicotinamide N-methyase